MLFTRTTDFVQKLQQTRRDPAFESALARLEEFDLLILDDLAYVTKGQAETSVLFELISTRYEQNSLLITANQPFGDSGHRGRFSGREACRVPRRPRVVHLENRRLGDTDTEALFW